MVSYKDEVLFHPNMGTYCMTVGKEVISAFAGPADDESFNLLTHKLSNDDHKIVVSEQRKKVIDLFAEVAYLRGEKIIPVSRIQELFESAKETDSQNWLLFLDLLEVATIQNYETVCKILSEYLKAIADQKREIAHLIEEGIQMIQESSTSRSTT